MFSTKFGKNAVVSVATAFLPFKKFPEFYETRKFITMDLLILSSPLLLGRPRNIYTSRFYTQNFLFTFVPCRATCLTHLILLNLLAIAIWKHEDSNRSAIPELFMLRLVSLQCSLWCTVVCLDVSCWATKQPSCTSHENNCRSVTVQSPFPCSDVMWKWVIMDTHERDIEQ
jgi:hypothetical protein